MKLRIHSAAGRSLFCLGLLLGFCAPAMGQEETEVKPVRGEDLIRVPAIGDGLSVSNAFQSHMVIQRDKPITLWGWASPGEAITISFA